MERQVVSSPLTLEHQCILHPGHEFAPRWWQLFIVSKHPHFFMISIDLFDLILLLVVWLICHWIVKIESKRNLVEVGQNLRIFLNKHSCKVIQTSGGQSYKRSSIVRLQCRTLGKFLVTTTLDSYSGYKDSNCTKILML